MPIDNNDVERDLRRIAVGRDNWLFIGSPQAGERTATILTIIASAHRHDLDVWSYVRDALERLARGRAAAGGDVHKIDPEILESLLPDIWAKTHPECIRTFRANEKQQRAEPVGSNVPNAAAQVRRLSSAAGVRPATPLCHRRSCSSDWPATRIPRGGPPASARPPCR